MTYLAYVTPTLFEERKLIIPKIREIAQSYHKDDSSGHDFYHLLRTSKLGLTIAEKEEADEFIVEASSLLHDLFRPVEKEKGLNYHVSPEALSLIGEILNQVGTYPEDLKRIKRAIRLHECYCFSTEEEDRIKSQQNDLEGKILQDADQLDAIGAIGIARAFTFGGHHGRPIYIPGDENFDPQQGYNVSKLSSSTIKHFYDKLLRINEHTMNTATGKEVARDRNQYMEQFLAQFFAEWKGER